MSLFCERLKEVRGKLRYGQGEFAELAGVNRRTQINYENGSRAPNTDYLLAVSAIGVDITYLLTGKDLDKVISDKLTAALALSRQIQPEGGELVELAIKSIKTEGGITEAAPDYLLAREQQLLANYRASSESGQQALQVAATAMAQQAAGDKTKGT